MEEHDDEEAEPSQAAEPCHCHCHVPDGGLTEHEEPCCDAVGPTSRTHSLVGDAFDEKIRALKEKACECRDADGQQPGFGADNHAAVHDCDVELYELCKIALGDNPRSEPRTTADALAMQIDARTQIAAHIEAQP